jgi:hypothetical protein
MSALLCFMDNQYNVYYVNFKFAVVLLAMNRARLCSAATERRTRRQPRDLRRLDQTGSTAKAGSSPRAKAGIAFDSSVGS